MKTIITSGKIGEVAAEATNGKEFIDLLKNNNPDLVLMDIDMPQMNGIEATSNALKQNPDLKVLFLTTFGDEAHYYSAIDAGGKGFLLKSAGIDELKNAIIEISNGGNYISRELLREIVSKINKEHNATSAVQFLQNELAILKHLSKGIAVSEIAEIMSIETAEVENLKNVLLEKTQTKNIAGLLMYCIQKRIIIVS